MLVESVRQQKGTRTCWFAYHWSSCCGCTRDTTSRFLAPLLVGLLARAVFESQQHREQRRTVSTKYCLRVAEVRWSRELQSAEANVVNNMHSNELWHEEIVAILFRHRDGAVESPVDTVALELVDQVIEKHEGVVDGDHFHIQWHGTRAFQYDRSSQCPTVPAWLTDSQEKNTNLVDHRRGLAANGVGEHDLHIGARQHLASSSSGPPWWRDLHDEGRAEIHAVRFSLFTAVRRCDLKGIQERPSRRIRRCRPPCLLEGEIVRHCEKNRQLMQRALKTTQRDERTPKKFSTKEYRRRERDNHESGARLVRREHAPHPRESRVSHGWSLERRWAQRQHWECSLSKQQRRCGLWYRRQNQPPRGAEVQNIASGTGWTHTCLFTGNCSQLAIRGAVCSASSRGLDRLMFCPWPTPLDKQQNPARWTQTRETWVFTVLPKRNKHPKMFFNVRQSLTPWTQDVWNSNQGAAPGSSQTDLDKSPPGRRTVPSVSNLEEVRRHILHAHMVDGTRQAPRLVRKNRPKRGTRQSRRATSRCDFGQVTIQRQYEA